MQMLTKNTKNTEFLTSKTEAFDIKTSTHKLTRVKEKLTPKDFELATGLHA